MNVLVRRLDEKRADGADGATTAGVRVRPEKKTSDTGYGPTRSVRRGGGDSESTDLPLKGRIFHREAENRLSRRPREAKKLNFK